MGIRMSGSVDLRRLCFHLTVSVILVLLSGRVDVVVSQPNWTPTLTTPGQCADRNFPLPCQNDGDGSRQRQAIKDTFSVGQPIDLVFIVCATNDCIGNDHSGIELVTEFIIRLIDYLATAHKVKIDPNSAKVAVITYNHSTAWPFFDGISSGAKKIDSCQFKNITRSLKTLPSISPAIQTCKLADALELAKATLSGSRSVRPNARQVVWVFSDCRYCDRGKGEPTGQVISSAAAIQNAAVALKKSNSDGVTVFTLGGAPCNRGYFDTIDKENLLRSVASPDSSNESHYACIDSWMKFAFFESSETSNASIYADPGEGTICDRCPLKNDSNHRCLCNVVGDGYINYLCQDTLPVAPMPKVVLIGIEVGAGGGGAVLIVVVVIIIVVVCFRRGRGCKNRPPPAVPRRLPPPVPPRPPTNTTEPDEGTNGYTNTDTLNNAIAETELELDYEIMECEKDMAGWSAHLATVKREFVILDLGVYSATTEDYFAQTPGFAISSQQKTRIHEIMANQDHLSRRLSRHLSRSRMVSVVTVGSIEFTVDGRTLRSSHLSARSSDKVLVAATRDGYIGIGVARLNRDTACQSAVKRVLDDVTRQ